MRYLAALFLLLTQLSLASAGQYFVWEGCAPKDIEQDYVQANSFLDEKPSQWRKPLRELLSPAVQNCKSACEAALLLAPQMGKLTGVRYDTTRSHPCLNPLQSMAEGKASCTGLSILLAASMRSLGIPARIVGIAQWSHCAGNHTWVEVYIEGSWQMLEFNEPAFNTPWVMDAISYIAEDNPNSRVMALAPSNKGKDYFPLVWHASNHSIGAVDVTKAYLKRAQAWYEQQDFPKNTQRIMLDVLPRQEQDIMAKLCDATGKIVSQALLPKPQHDMRQFACLFLPREKNQQYYLHIEGREALEVKQSPSPTQIITLITTKSIK